jgi:RNA polymerase sigma-70 factor (ECF subfamily)
MPHSSGFGQEVEDIGGRIYTTLLGQAQEAAESNRLLSPDDALLDDLSGLGVFLVERHSLQVTAKSSPPDGCRTQAAPAALVTCQVCNSHPAVNNAAGTNFGSGSNAQMNISDQPADSGDSNRLSAAKGAASGHEGHPVRPPPDSSAGSSLDPEPAATLGGAIDPVSAEAYAGWVALVERIKSSEPGSMEELYQLFSKGIRFYLCRQLGPQELDDKVHDTFVVVVQAIRRGELREPERLMGFVRTIVRRQVAAHIDKVVHNRREQVDLDSTVRVADPRENPEESAIFQQRAQLIQKVLGELPERDREILTRFYLNEQSQDQICTEMSLSETQFRLLKSRAKARFGELGKKKLAQKSLQAVFLRTSGDLFH